MIESTHSLICGGRNREISPRRDDCLRFQYLFRHSILYLVRCRRKEAKQCIQGLSTIGTDFDALRILRQCEASLSLIVCVPCRREAAPHSYPELFKRLFHLMPDMIPHTWSYNTSHGISICSPAPETKIPMLRVQRFSLETRSHRLRS